MHNHPQAEIIQSAFGAFRIAIWRILDRLQTRVLIHVGALVNRSILSALDRDHPQITPLFLIHSCVQPSIRRQSPFGVHDPYQVFGTDLISPTHASPLESNP